jgi:hypothetical protein
MADVNGPNKDAILKEIDDRRKEADEEGQHFTPPPDQPFAKGSDRVCIVWQAWNRSVSPGGTLVYSVGIANPTPRPQSNLFAHVFTGPGPVAVTTESTSSATVGAVDSRFPRLTSPRFAGLMLDPGAIVPLSFTIPVPANVEPSSYIGNCLLFQPVWHDPRGHLDRSLFLFEVAPRVL